MRLWHKDLISVLPRKQLLAQWRECCAIASNIANKGTPNHILVNKIIEYPQIHFVSYVSKILREMKDRGYKINQGSYDRFTENLCKGREYFWHCDDGIVVDGNVFPGWHNNRYLIQCYRNLQEKYDCGAISDEDMNKIFQVYESKIGFRMYKM